MKILYLFNGESVARRGNGSNKDQKKGDFEEGNPTEFERHFR